MKSYIDKAYLDSLLTNPEKVYAIDTIDYLHHYEKVKDKLIPVKGLYITGIGKPIVEFSTSYYVYNGDSYTLITSVEDIKITKSDIYIFNQGEYEVRYKYSSLKKIVDSLTITPKVNYAYVKFLEHMVSFIVQRFLEYTTYVDNRKLTLCLKPESRSYITADEFIDDFSDLYELISDLVYENRWNMYFIRTVDTSIIVERGVDYRIYDWCLSKIPVED